MAGGTKNTTNHTQHLDNLTLSHVEWVSPLSIWAIDRLRRVVPASEPESRSRLTKRTCPKGIASEPWRRRTLCKTKPNFSLVTGLLSMDYLQNKPKYPRFHLKNKLCPKNKPNFFSVALCGKKYKTNPIRIFQL
jgi:hypothetical protein